MVQVALNDASYASALVEQLERTLTREVCCIPVPDPLQEGVIVVDSAALDDLPLPLIDPDRVVLITRNDPRHLAQAWNAGIRSVVFAQDPLGTAVLAIMAAELRVASSGSAAYPDGCRPRISFENRTANALKSGTPDAKPRREGLR